MPATLLEELRRDRRWCQGNLQNFRLFASKGLHPAHRAVFMTGVMAYLSAPLWFISLALSTAILAVQVVAPPEYFTHPYQLFPVWPEWHPRWAVALFGATAALLFLPKGLALLVALRRSRRFGGAGRLAVGVAIESVFSALLAPIRMLFHTQFVLSGILGVTLSWRSPARSDSQTTWGEAIRHHGPGTLLGALWAGAIGWLDPHYLWWLAPVVGALIVAIPLSVWSSRVSLGRWCRRLGLFVIPEETRPPAELRALKRHHDRQVQLPGFAEAVVDPLVNAMVCASEAPHPRTPTAVRDQRLRRAHTALSRGPAQLDAAAQNAVLNDPICLSQMHFQVWSASDLATYWGPFMS
jgi:membrane glycosyltransferase